jgi:hypothetical protein
MHNDVTAAHKYNLLLMVQDSGRPCCCSLQAASHDLKRKTGQHRHHQPGAVLEEAAEPQHAQR